MNTTNLPINNDIKHMIKENYSFDYSNYYLTKTIKFLINFILMYFFIDVVISNFDKLTKLQIILSICAFSSVLLYILDNNLPSYNNISIL